MILSNVVFMVRHGVLNNVTKLSNSRFSQWSKLPLAPPDKILGLNEMFNQDNHSLKVNLGVGAYRDENGNPLILNSVSQAKKLLESKSLNHEYTSIAGIKSFVDNSIKFAYGEDSPEIKKGNIDAVQTLSGTGACRLFGEFIAKFFGKNTKIYLPDPTVSVLLFLK